MLRVLPTNSKVVRAIVDFSICGIQTCASRRHDCRCGGMFRTQVVNLAAKAVRRACSWLRQPVVVRTHTVPLQRCERPTQKGLTMKSLNLFDGESAIKFVLTFWTSPV